MRIANLNDRLVPLTADGPAVDIEQISAQMQSSAPQFGLGRYVEGIGELHQTFCTA